MRDDTNAACEACRGNVLPGKTCYACGLQGPAGAGMAMAAILKASDEAERLRDILRADAEEWDRLFWTFPAGDDRRKMAREHAETLRAQLWPKK